MTEIFKLKDGGELILRPVQAQDYDAVQIYVDQIATETIFLNLYVGQEHPLKEKFEENITKCWMMIAMDGDKVAGIVSAHIKKPNHPWFNKVCGFGISMLNAYQHQGLGYKFMNLLEEWAKDNQMHRIEGHVRHLNTAGLALYVNTGYIIEGCLHDCACIDGVWHHDYVIAKILD